MPAENKYTFKIIGDDQTKKAFASIAKQTRSLVNTVGKFSAGMGAGLIVMARQSIQANAEVSRLARTIGVTTQTLTEWTHAGERVNIQGDKMADIMKDVSDKIGDLAVTGGGGAVDMFEKLNLNIHDFVGLAPDEQLLKIGEALDDVQTRSEKTFFLEALAGDASRLLPLLENDAELLKEMTQEARDLGIAIDDVDAAQMEAANESMERVAAAGKGFLNEVAIKLAPIIEIIAKNFLEMGREAGGAGGIVQKGFDVGVKLAGWMADGVHAIKIAFKALGVVARAVNAGLASGIVFITEGFVNLGNTIIKGVIAPFRKLLELLAPVSDTAAEALAGVQEFTDKIALTVPEGLRAFADAQHEAFGAARAELHAMLMEDLPSEALKANVERIMAEAEALALQEAQRIRERLSTDSGEGTDTSDTTDQLALERERMLRRIASIGEVDQLELLQLQEKKLQEQAILDEALSKQFISDEHHKAKMMALEQSHQQRVKALKAKEMHAQVSLTAGILSNMASLFAGSGKRSFKLQKKVALAKALVTLPSAVLESYNRGGGFPYGIPPAAAMAAKGAAEIANIKRTNIGSSSIGSSGGAGGGSSSTAANALQQANIPNPPTEQQTPGKQVIVNLGTFVARDEEAVEWLGEALGKAIDEKDFVLFSNTNSAQAQLLPQVT